jgi:hypothetical protein
MPGDVAESGAQQQRQRHGFCARSLRCRVGLAAPPRAPITLAAIVAGTLAPVQQHIAGVGQDRDAIVLFFALGQRVERGAVLCEGTLNVIRRRLVAEAEKFIQALLFGHVVPASMPVFRFRVVRLCGGVVVQDGVGVLAGQAMADPLRQQRSGNHADDRDAEPDQLRRHRAGFADQHLDQYPGGEAAEDRRQRALVVARRQKMPAASGTKAPARVTL